jgi:hypothetical protein
MRKIIRRLLAATAAGVLVCAAGCARRKGSEETAARLLRVAEIHAVYAEGYVAGYRDSALRDGRPQKEIDCFANKVTPELVLPALTDAYSKEFSDDELRHAISFFESETGKSFIRYQRNLAKAAIGNPTEEVPEFSPPEADRINAFVETRIGRLIMNPDSAPMFATAKAELHRQISGVITECRNAR